MSDRLMCDDLETDGEVCTASARHLGHLHARQKCEYPGEKHACQDRIDSGIGSLSFSSCDSVLSEIRSQICSTEDKNANSTAARTDNSKCDSVDDLASRLKDTAIDSDDDEGIASFDADAIVVKKCTKVTDRITEDALEVYGRDLDGDTLLHVSIIQDCDQLTREFIRLAPWNNWLDIYNDKLRQTPLHLAAIVNKPAVARALTVGGADIEMRDHNGDTALHIACRKGHSAVVGALLKPVMPAETQQTEYECRVSSIPQNLELRNSDGCTCAHLAGENGHLDILRTLISHGAQINAGDGKSGASVLHVAANKNDVKLTQFLLKQRGIEMDKEMYNGTTPLMVAYGRKHTEVFDLLVKAGACTDDLDWSSSEEED